MLTNGQRHVLRFIVEQLASKDVTWTLTGSASFVLQGMDEDVGDIDLQSDETGIYRIQDAFHEYVVKPVALSGSDRIRSHFGELRIRGEPVEIMGAIQKRSRDGRWLPVPDLALYRREVFWEGLVVPVLSLEYEAGQYDLLGRHQKAARIREFMGDQ